MAYVKTVWETGDVITAEKLNNAEGGIEAHDPLIINGVVSAGESGYVVTFGITGAELFAALAAGKKVVLHYPENTDVGLNEAYSQIDYVNRESDGDGGYYYGAEDSYCKSYLRGMPGFTEDNNEYTVSVGTD